MELPITTSLRVAIVIYNRIFIKRFPRAGILGPKVGRVF
jgi:hypothetical protein